MSDYLANLVTRSVGPVEGVRPRLAALFEPPRGLGGALAGADAETETAAEAAAEQPISEGMPREHAPERQATTYPALARTPVAAPQSAPVAPIVQQVAHTPTPPAFIAPRASGDVAGDTIGRAAPPQGSSVPVASALPPALIAPAEHSPRQPDRVSAPLVPLDRSAPDNQREQRGATVDATRGSRREPLIERIVIERNVPTELRSANADAPPVQRHDPRQPAIAAAAPVAPPTVSRTTPPLIVRAESPSGLIARPLPAAMSVQPRLPTHGEPAEPASAEPPTPIIQVTIGRIDVRATPAPAAPAQRQRATPPVMGLDDYLRQRAKRGSG